MQMIDNRRQPSAVCASLVVAMLTLATVRPAASVEWITVSRRYPLCGTHVVAKILGSHTTFGAAPDFRPRCPSFDTYLAGYIQCPTCGFCRHANCFDVPQSVDRDELRRLLQAAKPSPLFAKYDRAILVERHGGNDPQAIASLTLGAKWLADDLGERAVMHRRIDTAIKARVDQIQALSQIRKAGQNVDQGELRAATYLVGELCRQRGNRQRAMEWFGLAQTGTPDEDLAPKTFRTSSSNYW